jgi:sugar phosphate isomerase/epimerase
MRRRDFLRNTTALAASLAVVPSSLFEVPSTPIGLQLWSVRDAMAKDAMGTLKTLAKHGYKYTEAFGFNDGKWFGMPVKEFKKALADLGMSQKSSHEMITAAQYTAANKTLPDSFKKAVDAALEMGQKYIICPYMIDEDRNKEKVAILCEAYNKAGEYCNSKGIRYGYHNHDFEFTTRVDNEPMYRYMLNNTEAKLVAFEMDMCWVVRGKYNPVDWFNLYPGRFELSHMKDLTTQDKSETAIVGEGIVDFKQIIANQRKAGMKLWIVELENYKTTSTQDVGVSYKNLRKILA